jgi:cell division protein FtsQ
MWDKPDILNRAANVLYGAAAVLALYAVAAAVVHLPLFPLREVQVVGAPGHVTLDQVENIVKHDIRGNFFTVDLAAARAAFERLPWVRRVQVRRLWPGRLDVAFEEHVALARWGSRALVNVHGEVFQGAYDGRLPVFTGPEGAAKEIAIQYEYFRRSLGAIGQEPVEVRVSPRRAWQLRLSSGLTLELGREHTEARLARFVASYERTLAKLDRPIDYVDLRYSNGFAVRIPELRFEKAPRRGRDAA